MTTSPTTDIQPELLPVIQADRDQAAEYDLMVGRVSPLDAIAIRAGEWDGTGDVQFFARHRLTSTTPTLGDMVPYGHWLPDAWDAYLRDLVGWENARGWAHLPATFRWSDFYDRLVTAMLSAAPASPIPTSVANEGEEWPAMLQRSAAKHAVVCAKLANATPIAGEPDPLWWERQSAIREAAVILAHIAALSPALDNTAVEVDPDLQRRCWEVLHWRKTGLLEGHALEAFGARHGFQADDADPAVARAERLTIKEALSFIVGLRTVQTEKAR